MKLNVVITEDANLKSSRTSIERLSSRAIQDNFRADLGVAFHPDSSVLELLSSAFAIQSDVNRNNLYKYPKLYEIIFHDKAYESEVDFVVDHCPFERYVDRDALIVGCGPGNHSQCLSDRGFEVHGIDPSEQMISRAREKVDGVFRTGRLPSLGGTKSFDVVWCPFTILNFVEPEDLQSAIQELCGRIKSDGILVLDCGEFRSMNRPNLQFVVTESGECVLLYQYNEIDDSVMEWRSNIYVGDKVITDREILYNHSFNLIEKEIERAGLEISTYSWYGHSSTLSDSMVFIAHA